MQRDPTILGFSLSSPFADQLITQARFSGAGAREGVPQSLEGFPSPGVPPRQWVVERRNFTHISNGSPCLAPTDEFAQVGDQSVEPADQSSIDWCNGMTVCRHALWVTAQTTSLIDLLSA